MQETKTYCDFCGAEVPIIKDEDGKNPQDLWDINITKVSPLNVSLSQYFYDDTGEDKTGQACKNCVLKYPKKLDLEGGGS